jgi:hypothetical protein
MPDTGEVIGSVVATARAGQMNFVDLYAGY